MSARARRRELDLDRDVVGVCVFVRVLDATGAAALLQWSPSQIPGTQWRHARPLPPRRAEQDVQKGQTVTVRGAK